MDFFIIKGKDFQEHFDFKNASGKPMALPGRNYRITLERGTFAKEYTVGRGLSKTRTQIIWSIPASESANFEYTTLYYTLYMDNTELARGVLKIQ